MSVYNTLKEICLIGLNENDITSSLPYQQRVDISSQIAREISEEIETDPELYKLFEENKHNVGLRKGIGLLTCSAAYQMISEHPDKYDKQIVEQVTHLQNFTNKLFEDEVLFNKFVDLLDGAAKSSIPIDVVLENEGLDIPSDEYVQEYMAGYIETLTEALAITPSLLLHAAPLITLGAIRILFPKQTVQVISQIIAKIQGILKSIQTSMAKSRFRFLALSNEYEECLKKCGVDPKQLSKPFSHPFYWSDMSSPLAGTLATGKTYNKSICMVTCYLFDFLPQMINVLAIEYYNCLKKSNIEPPKVTQYNVIEVLKTVSAQGCESYHNKLIDFIDNSRKMFEHMNKPPYQDKFPVKTLDQYTQLLGKQVQRAYNYVFNRNSNNNQ